MPEIDAPATLPTQEEYQATRRQILLAVGGSVAAAALGAASLLAGDRIKEMFRPRPVAGEISCPPIQPPVNAPPANGSGS